MHSGIVAKRDVFKRLGMAQVFCRLAGEDRERFQREIVNIRGENSWDFSRSVCHWLSGSPGEAHANPYLLVQKRLAERALPTQRRAGGAELWHSMGLSERFSSVCPLVYMGPMRAATIVGRGRLDSKSGPPSGG